MDAIRTAGGATAQDANGAVRSMRPERPLRVGVLVDLHWSPSAGGHVKFWERVAAGAVGLGGKVAGALDLTLHFAADIEDEYVIGRNVRYRLHKPVFSTRLTMPPKTTCMVVPGNWPESWGRTAATISRSLRFRLSGVFR